MVQVGDRTQNGRVCIISPNSVGWTNVWVECHDGTLPLFSFPAYPTLEEVKAVLGDDDLQGIPTGEVVTKQVRALPSDGGIPLPNGGRTIACTMREDGSVSVAIALCRIIDEFDARYGERLAEKRLTDADTYYVVVPDGTLSDVYQSALATLSAGPQGSLVQSNLAEVPE